ncbi:MAG: 1-deoxy-D-xylulose-5-phosphate synthase [Muribaculaceae bacterium]|nr:1-deoxy-D-xylulose-5-phosphate synthase [Muribaculaceae bacterium]
MNITDIHSPADIKGKSLAELQQICAELRKVLIKKLAAHGGHVGPNLGFLEPTVALHYVFDAPKDKIVFDVSHQTYVHKMLTGRIEAFVDPAKYDDVTGYTNPAESEYDLFSIGHTSTSISLASGLARARDLSGEKYNVVAVIGDGSLSGGQAFEGLDMASTEGTNFIVVVNDNQMSIAPNHGALYENLALLRETEGKAENNFFKSLGYDYIYVGQGNSLEALIAAFSKVKDSERPVVVHLNTVKGLGLPVAEEHKERFHFHGPFNPESGESTVADSGPDYIDIFANYMLDRMQRDPKTVLLTAGVPGAIGFGPSQREQAGRQFIDVGIAEEQAVAMASGLAKGGFNAVVGEPATFIQRAYDQLEQDVCINGMPVAFVDFYGGVWGMNDETHLGFLDIAMFSNIPTFLTLCPTCAEEYVAMLEYAISQKSQPVLVRTPGGRLVHRDGDFDFDYSKCSYETVREGAEVAIIGVGDFLPMALEAADIAAKKGLAVKVINPRNVSNLDENSLNELKSFRLVITLEDNQVDGGYGQKVAAYLAQFGVKVNVLGLPKALLDRYKAKELLEQHGLTPENIADIAVNC